eukprot:TRINITY_DN1991_c0_g1_i8.p1 TRINITY_DN1991_c0_g1~~TRINITY_DN1991_c0_g1_i8.p1  ORF type:complete len:360 (-),score=132.55 TRINITY_DN1991_c0_g1_i8:93-1172(-)
MSETLVPSTTEAPAKKKRNYRRDKPWDNDPTLDKWKIEEFKPEDNPAGLLEESSFSVLFPQYREKYIKEIWPLVKKELKRFYIVAEIDLTKGSMSVFTTRKTWDPYIIIKARDMIKLLSRSVPFDQAKRVLDDGVNCDVIKLKGITRSKEKFVKRRQRLIGPNGMTLKALQILTNCYILVQGTTVSAVGNFKDLKAVRRVVEDAMRNVHPIYNIKELMIKRELAKKPELAGEDWNRFLPHFKKQSQKRKEKRKKRKEKKEYTPFPPEQQPRKIDLMMESGEYFLTQEQKDQMKTNIKKKAAKEKHEVKAKKKEDVFVPPDEDKLFAERKRKFVTQEQGESLSDLKKKFTSHKKPKVHES